MSRSWERAIAELRAQGLAARASADRVNETAADLRQRTIAVAVHYAAETDYLRSALALLRAHLADGRPPQRLPAARVWPGPIRDLWMNQVLARTGGLWQAVPGAAVVDQMRSGPASPLLDAVIEQAEALQASLHGHRRHPRMYEKYFPERDGGVRADGGGRPAPTVPGFPDPGHPVNLTFAGGTGLRIQPARADEASRLKDDEFAVHHRALAFGDAVLDLLVEARLDGTRPQAGRLRGAGQWVGREEELVPARAAWPAKLNGFQAVTLAGLGLLVLACTALPLTFGKEADLFSHYTLLFAASGTLALAGTAIVHRTGPRLIQAPGLRAAAPGIASGLLALAVWQGQGPVADHFFAGPYERYERELAHGCLAASPYRNDAVQTRVDHGVLLVTPTSQGTTLRLGPAENGSTHPLRPVDAATRKVLDDFRC
ncbi:hypothetical protein PV721_23225 [Streptomyces sp. MB09-01]|uniref:hypothetical protein n=1 Tax=Streptomyces sp. MB09-01 TaxID=3028666 RepID=UPI0029A84CBD|nr:hypothetical protein [Streptomyces sp. MB09-01]MDX3537232.1 hypothetical protein [Streptomyces sp. MB09-01]